MEHTASKKTKIIELPPIPGSYNEITREQWNRLFPIIGSFRSETDYLTRCFLALAGLELVPYAEPWRRFVHRISFGLIPLRRTGRVLAGTFLDYLGMGEPMPDWMQLYRFEGSRLFYLHDWELNSFKEKLKFLNDPIVLSVNPIPEVCIRGEGGKKVVYRSFGQYLSDMDWYTYNICSMHLEQFSRTKNKKFLYLFLASFYRMDDPEQIPLVLSEPEQKLILLYWEGVLHYYSKCFPHLFKRNEKKEVSPDYMKMESSITVFIGKESGGALPEQVREMLAYDALGYLEANAVNVEEHNKAMAKIRR